MPKGGAPLPDKMSNVPVGLQGQGPLHLHAFLGHGGDLVLRRESRQSGPCLPGVLAPKVSAFKGVSQHAAPDLASGLVCRPVRLRQGRSLSYPVERAGVPVVEDPHATLNECSGRLLGEAGGLLQGIPHQWLRWTERERGGVLNCGVMRSKRKAGRASLEATPALTGVCWIRRSAAPKAVSRHG